MPVRPAVSHRTMTRSPATNISSTSKCEAGEPVKSAPRVEHSLPPERAGSRRAPGWSEIGLCVSQRSQRAGSAFLAGWQGQSSG